MPLLLETPDEETAKTGNFQTEPTQPDRATGWINVLTTSAPDLQEIRDALIGSRGAMLDKVSELDLPHIPYAHASVDDFINCPDQLADQVPGESYFYTIQPSDYISQAECPEPQVATLEKIIAVAEDFTTSATGMSFDIVLQQVKEIAYLGNVAISRDGNIYGEFTDQGIPPTRSCVSRLFCFRKDPILDTFHYDFDDPKLRTAIYRTISMLPHVGTGRDRIWNRGYYELCLVPNSSGSLSPMFYDFRKSDAFTNVAD